jgi:hypothetical protein
VDDPLIVRVDEEVGVRVTSVNREQEAKLDGYDFGPTDIPAVRVPSRREGPGVPYAIEDDADTP